MNRDFRRYLLGSTVTHIVVVVLMLLAGLFLHMRKKKPKPVDIMAYIDVAASVPDIPALQPVDEVKIPDPPTPPEDIPEPPKEKPKPEKKKIEISKKRIKRDDQPPPAKKKPQLSPQEIKKLLASGLKPSDHARPPTDDFPFAWYLALVRQTMYDAWAQPSELSSSAGLVTVVALRVQKDGTITRRELAGASGNHVMDNSVMKAVRSVSRLKPLPPKFGGAYKDITVEFELTGPSF